MSDTTNNIAKSTKRNGTIDLMKFLFTLMVMIYHTNKMIPGGYIAVDFFFIVSGFLLAKSMEKRLTNGIALGTDTVSFVLHKAKALFPYYLVAWLMSFAITMYVKGNSGSDSLTVLFRSFYNVTMTEMVGNYDMGHRLQASWYVSAMLLGILIIYPIRKKFTNTFDNVIAPIVFLIFVGMAYQGGVGVSNFTVGYKKDLYVYNGLIRGIAEMSFGCISYNICNKIRRNEYTVLGSILLSIIEWVGFGLVIYFAFTTKKSDIDLALLPVIALSVAISFSNKSLLDRLFSGKLFVFLGSFSLQMYFTHELVKNIIIPYLRKTTEIEIFKIKETGTYLLYYIALTILAAIVCRALGKLLETYTHRFSPKLKKLLVK